MRNQVEALNQREHYARRGASAFRVTRRISPRSSEIEVQPRNQFIGLRWKLKCEADDFWNKQSTDGETN